MADLPHDIHLMTCSDKLAEIMQQLSRGDVLWVQAVFREIVSQNQNNVEPVVSWLGEYNNIKMRAYKISLTCGKGWCSDDKKALWCKLRRVDDLEDLEDMIENMVSLQPDAAHVTTAGAGAGRNMFVQINLNKLNWDVAKVMLRFDKTTEGLNHGGDNKFFRFCFVKRTLSPGWLEGNKSK